MYYSPKKNIESFIQSKNEQIKSLKQKILGSRVTYQDMENAKSRLASLKSSHLGLQKQDHLDLKEVLKSSLQAVNDLVKKKNRLLEQLEQQEKQTHEMTDLEYELSTKHQKAQQFLREMRTVQDKLLEKKERKNREIIDLEEQITTRRKELTMEREIGDELHVARTELKSKSNKITAELTAVSEDNKKLRESIRKELEEITRLEHENENNQLRTQNLQLKIEKQQKCTQNLQQKIDAAQTFLQRFSQDRLIYLKQAQTAQNIDSLLKMCTQSNEKKHKEQRECQEEINALEKKIQGLVAKRYQLQGEVAQKQQNLKQLKEKGAELKSILNSIFHQDSSVLKLLADKKVYESEPVKKPQSYVNANVKQDMLDLVATSDNFFVTGNTSSII